MFIKVLEQNFMMTDIILFQPKCGLMDVMGARTPSGLLSIAAVPVKEGYKVALIDQRIDSNWQTEIKKHLAAGTKIFCLTTMVGEQINFVADALAFVKSLDPKILTVLGGSWAQIQPEMCMQEKNADIICCGEGDYLLTDLLDYCNGKKQIENVLGIVFRDKEGNIKKTAPRPFIKNLDELPKIPYHLVDLKKYAAVGFRPGKMSMSLVTSRGCQFRCKFCSIVTLSRAVNEEGEMISHLWRGNSVDRIMEDLRDLEENYGIKDFFFNDDLISGNHNRLIELAKRLAEENRDYNWGSAGIRGDHVLRFSDEDMENLIKSGCKNLDVGVESGHPRMLKLMKKDTTTDIIRRVNQKLSKYPIIVKFTFMGGFPTETEEEFLETLKFRRTLQEENEYATAPIFFYTPFPGTELFQIAIENGFVPPKTLKEWADFNYHTWYKKYPCWLTKGMIRLVENAVFLSYFSNKKLGYKYPNPLTRALFKLYYPIAKLRYDNNYYGFMVDKHLADMAAKVGDKLNLFNLAQKMKQKKEEQNDKI